MDPLSIYEPELTEKNISIWTGGKEVISKVSHTELLDGPELLKVFWNDNDI